MKPGEITTVSGRVFNLIEPREEDVYIGDIAHHLALINRFGGATPVPYNVAQHSWAVSVEVPAEHALQGLLHDAAEAYVGDVVSPLKHLLSAYKDIETQIWRVIARKYGVPAQICSEVEIADKRVLVTEQRDIRRLGSVVEIAAPYTARMEPWSWKVAKHVFLTRFDELYRGQASNAHC